MNIKKRLSQKLIAMLIVFVMVISNLGIIGGEVIAYAETAKTNNSNVEIVAYFEDEEGNMLDEIESFIGETLILKLDVTVKNDDGLGGYFDGTINIKESNFKLVDSSDISLYVEAGYSKTIEREIEYQSTDNVTSDYLTKSSNIILTGTYTNSKKDYEIEGETSIIVNWKTSEETTSALKASVLTNKDYTIEEEIKRLVQVYIKSSLSDNTELANTTEITITVPEGAEEVTAHRRTTNADTLEDLTYSYDSENNLLTINSNSNGSQDIIVVTYKYAEGTEISDALNVTNKIITYDGAERSAETTIEISDEKDGIVSTDISQGESSIYKGKIYTGEDRTYSTTTKINIDLAEAISSIDIKENAVKYTVTTDEGEEEKTASITYVKTTINKEKFLSLFGEEGYITIKDQDGNTVANITNESETNDNGDIEIAYGSVTSIEIITSEPQTEGILEIKHEKKISESKYSREEIEEFTAIKESNKTINEENETANTKSSKIELKETKSTANISLETESLSTTEDDQELEIRVTLETDDESKDLYKNPTIQITLPEEITATGAKYRVLYGNGLEGESGKLNEEDGKSVITVNLSGEQKSYSGEAVNGTIIDIIVEVDVDNLSTSKTKEVELKYTNEMTDYTGIDTAEIEIVAENTMILTNNAVSLGVSTQGSDDSQDVELQVESEATNETITMQIVNNEGTEITDIKILGNIPADGESIKLSSEVQSSKNASIYYSEVTNPSTDLDEETNEWSESMTESSSYFLVIIDSLEKDGTIELSYDLEITADLEYNLEEVASYYIEYTNSSTKLTSSVVSSSLTFTTGAIADLNTTVKAVVGTSELTDGSEVKAGEIITYEVTVVNEGKEDATDVTISGSVPDNTTLIEVNEDYWVEEETDDDSSDSESYYIEKTDTEVTEENITIAAGETKTFTYMVKVNTDIEDNTESTAEINVLFEENTFTQTITHVLRTGNLSAVMNIVQRSEGDELIAGYVYQYGLTITNISDTDQENIQISLNTNDLITIYGGTVYYSDETWEEFEETNTLTLSSLSAGEEVYIEVDGLINQPTDELDVAEIYTTLGDEDGNTYTSNQISESVNGYDITVELTSTTNSENETGYVSYGDEIEYTIKVENTGAMSADYLVIADKVSDYLDIETVTLNEEEIEYNVSYVFDSDEEENDYSLIEIDSPLDAGESVEVVITGTVMEISSSETIKVRNQVIIYNDIEIAESDEIIYYIEGTNLSSSESSSDEDQTDGETSDEDETTTSGYEISGIVWIDEDGDGEKSSTEGTLSGITVYAVEVSSNDIKQTTTTASEGFYTLSSLEEGSYIVVFEYDTLTYLVTTYQADGVEDSKNSDAVKSSMLLNDERKEVATTDSIELTSNVANINLGLIEAKVFDLDIAKTVSKIIVTNDSGTTTYDQDEDETLAKVEIASKYLSGSSVSIEYTISITNNGEVAGYAKSIVDYLPSALSFSSSLNEDWYQSGEYIYNSSLANTLIEAGETEEITLVLTKTMTSSNTGLINNEAEIDDSYNSLGISESDKEDVSSAEVIIGVKTGAAVSYIVLTIVIIIAICSIAYFINKKFLKIKIEI